MIARWLGGPFDGRLDELPNGTHAVSVAHPTGWFQLMDRMASEPIGYVEVRCNVVNTEHGWVIKWHEP
jgi:hypothetical protein